MPVKPLTAPLVIENGIVIWGDSMAAGDGASGLPTRWGAIVAKALGSEYFNGAVGGSTSTQAAEKQRADTAHRGWLAIYWTGHNNPVSETVVADIGRMVARQTQPRRFLVLLPVQHAEAQVALLRYRRIMLLGADLMAAFPNNWVDIRGPLSAAANQSTDDKSAVANGYSPPSLRSDPIHLNDAGNAVVAKAVLAAIRQRGWDKATVLSGH